MRWWMMSASMSNKRDAPRRSIQEFPDKPLSPRSSQGSTHFIPQQSIALQPVLTPPLCALLCDVHIREDQEAYQGHQSEDVRRC